MRDDAALLREFATQRSESAFAELVHRHIDAVYSAALRRVGGDTHLAEDVTQHVFTALATKATTLTRHPFLTAWLYTATRHQAANTVRAERRRRAREQEAMEMHESSSAASAEPDWRRIASVLDQAIDQLGESDRTALLLRFVERQPFADIGTRLQLSEDAARMRVDRALDKLRCALARRGVTSTAAALGVALSNDVVHAAPAALMPSVTSGSVAAVTTIAGTATGLIELMTTTKASLTAATAAVLLGVGSATYEYQARASASAALLVATSARDALAARIQTLRQDLERMQSRTAELKQRLARQSEALAQPAPRAGISSTAASHAKSPRDPLEAGTAFLARHPEVKEALRRWFDRVTDTNFGGLYTTLSMTSAEIEALRTLQRDTSSYGQYLGDNEQLVQLSLRTDANAAEAWNRLRMQMGDDRFAKLGEYIAGQRSRLVAESLAGALAFSEPLTAAQTEQFTAAVRNAQRASRDDSFDWDRISADAATFLTPSQQEMLAGVRALREFWAESERVARSGSTSDN